MSPLLINRVLVVLAAGLVLSACNDRKDPPLAGLQLGDAAGSSAYEKSAATEPVNLSQSRAKADEPRAEYIDGSGMLFRGAGKRPDPAKLKERGTDAGLRFREADISAIADAIIGNSVGAAYVVDPAVQGTLTLETTGELTPDQLLVAFEEALKVKGFALVARPEGYNIVPLQKAPRMSALRAQLPPRSSGAPGFSVLVITPDHLAPTNLQSLLEPFAPTGAVLKADDNRNLLIVGGTSQELDMVLQTIATFDVDWMKGMSMAFYKLRYVEANTLTNELKEILTRAGDPLAGVVKLIPVPRINQILGVAADSQKLKEIEGWLNRLDVQEAGDGRRMYVYQVRNAQAEELATSLNYIVYGDEGQGSSNSGAVSANLSPSQMPGVNRANQQQTRGQQSERGGAGGSFEALRILPSRENNSLLILATPSEYAIVESALQRLDVPPRQVLIEASLAEVTLNNDLRFGLQWSTELGDNRITFSQAEDGSIAERFPGVSVIYTGSSDAFAVLNALEGVTDVNVISSPKLLVLNNQSAVLQVGDEVPVPRQSSVSTQGGNSPIVNSIEYRSTGVILTIKPRINDGGLVYLDITQEVSSVSENISSGIDAPIINQRRISSTVAVKDGQTIALGGLIRSSNSKTYSGLPVLSKIPLLGALFRENSVTDRKTELIVLLSPRIMADADQLKATMQDLQKQFKNVFAEPATN